MKSDLTRAFLFVFINFSIQIIVSSSQQNHIQNKSKHKWYYVQVCEMIIDTFQSLQLQLVVMRILHESHEAKARDNSSAIRNSSAGKTCQWLRQRSGNIKSAIKGRKLVVAGNEIIFNPVYSNIWREKERERTALADAKDETGRSWGTPEETRPSFEAKFNDAIKIWRSLGGAVELYIFSDNIHACNCSRNVMTGINDKICKI